MGIATLAAMAKYDRQLQVLSEELVEAVQDAIDDLDNDRDSILLLRHAGVDQYLARRYRTRAVQQIESAMKSLERIHDKLGIMRHETVFAVFDRYAELHALPRAMQVSRWRENPRYIQDDMEAVLERVSGQQP